jgi:hypothetical protein
VEELFRSIEFGKRTDFAKALGVLNTKYIVIDKKSDMNGTPKVYYYFGAPFIQGNSSYFQDFMNIQDGITKVYEDENFIIYKNSYFLPTLYTISAPNDLSTIYEPLSLDNLTYINGKISKINRYTTTYGCYTFKINVNGPTFLILSEMYHPLWKAYANGNELQHYVALGWANGFLIPAAGEYEIRILFQPQDTRNLLINSWLISWSIMVTAIVVLIFKRIVFH